MDKSSRIESSSGNTIRMDAKYKLDFERPRYRIWSILTCIRIFGLEANLLSYSQSTNLLAGKGCVA